MPLSVTIPTLGKPKSVKDAVISVLSHEWPLTAKKIYNIIRKTHSLSVSYQAVHKVLAEMVRDGTLAKDGKEYSISPEWIERNKKFYEELRLKIESSGKPTIEEALSSSLTEMHFDNLYEFYSFILTAIERIVEMSKGQHCGNEMSHMYWALASSKKEQEQFKRIFQLYPRSYFICRGDTFADRMLAKFYEGFGAKVRTGVDCARNCDVMVGGGYVIQIFFDRKLKAELDKLYESVNDINTANMSQLYNQIFDKKVRVNVIIKRDQDLAGEIIENVVRCFDKGD